ncbi:dihydropteroate synthase [Aeromicrobium terrae]|nr:dihydropteroate synthase [Aeromicrobium terrae]
MSEILRDLGRCRVMGVVNVTPDSFSDGGRWLDPPTAVRHGLDLVAQGADLVDVGGESTRPGALRIDAEEELRRVIPVVTGLVAEGVTVSVDTMRSEVAERALEAGASLVNDVSGGRADPRMTKLAAQAGVPIVLMHWRGHSDSMQKLTQYDDVVADVVRELTAQVDAALGAGVRPEQVVVDPGLGFSKTGDQNWTVLANLHAFTELGYPVMVAASRKRFLGELLAEGDELRPTDDREDATAALTTVAARAGVWCVRVHEAGPSADAVRVVARLAQEEGR